MSRFIVAYDLHEATSTDYDDVAEAIKKCGDAVELQRSVWLVATGKLNKEQICKNVGEILNEKDRIFVGELKNTYRRGHSDEIKSFLQRNPLN